MDDFDHKLKADARSLPADVSPELEARLKAAVNATRPVVKPERRSSPPFAWWWISSLSGVAALLLIVTLVFPVTDDGTPPVLQWDSPSASTIPSADEMAIPDAVRQPLVQVPLDVRTADFAEPLAEELEKLKSDLEKARNKLSDDLRFTL